MTKIMLVEDDKSLREIYGIRLLAEGYEIKSAGDGEEALAMAIKERPDLILSDVMMPKISGFDMLDILRSTPETKDVKVIMMTALSSEDQRARGESLGANRYLVKSQVGIEDVVRTVHDVLADIPEVKNQTNQAFGAVTPSAPVAATPPQPTPTTASAPVAPSTTVSQPQPAVEPVPIPTPVTATPSTPAPTIAPPINIEPISTPKIIPTDESHPEPAPVFAPQPVVAPAPTQTTEMPRPTAPFSSSPPASLGNAMINPIQPTMPVPDIATMIDHELNEAPPAPTPQIPGQPNPPQI